MNNRNPRHVPCGCLADMPRNEAGNGVLPDLACTWNETDDVEVWNRPPRSARITGHFDPRYERPVTYTLSHPLYLFGQTEYEQNARYCPKPSDDDQTDYLGVGIPFPDECWCCHWQTCDTNCTCGCTNCGRWAVSPTNDYDFARTNYPHMGDVLKIRTPSEYSASVALSVPAGMRRCCPCPEHHTNGVSCVYTRRVSVVGPSGSEFRSSGEPVTVRIAATEPSYEPGDGRALFATNGAFSLSCDYTCLGVGISAYDIDLPALNAKNRQFGLPVVVNTNLGEAVEIRLDVNVLLRGGRIRLSVEDASAPLEVWGYDYVRRERVKLADADNALDVTMAEWRRMTGHADDSGVPTTYVQLLVPRTGQATLVLHYWNVIDGAFVEDEARQVVTAINPPLRADMDHDGDVDEHDAEKLASGRPFWFWVNDDRIKGDYAGAIEGNSYNATDFKVNGKFDLVNLFPIVADASAFKAAWGDSVTYELRGSSGYLNFCVLRDIGADETYAMQTGTVYAVTGEPLESATLSALGSRGTNITYYVENSERSQVVFAFESKGSVYPSISPELLVKVSGRTVLRYRIPLSLSSVDSMYRFCNIRSAASNPSFVPTVPGQAVEWSEDGQDVDLFFTHGFNVSLEDARNWGRILFKRFWHSGLNARFHMLTWEGNYSILPGERFNPLHYQHDVWYALRTGGALKRYIEAAQPDSTKRVLMTQSLGNMVACEALKEGLHVGHYFMFDAALPGESIDESLQARSLESPAFVKYVPTDWQDYNYMSWAANWHRLFKGDPDDARGLMGWPGYFTTALGNADNVYNYYSSGDDVFKEFGAVPSRFDGLDEAKELYCWQKQETLKGSAVLAGTAYAGWAFHHWTVHELVHDIGGGVHYEDRDYKYSPDDAARMIANGSITNNPVFNSDFSPMFDPDASLDDQWLALGKYVPAVSSPVGGLNITSDNIGFNIDMNLDSSNGGVPRPNEWGRSANNQYGLDWQHSDMKDMAFFYVYMLYKDLITKGNLK